MAAVGEAGVTEELHESLVRRLDEDVDWDQSYSWFDREMRGPTGIDVFADRMDPAAPSWEWRGERVDLLLLETEALRGFTGGPGLAFEARNTGTGKYYAAVYRRIL
jgi:hypothetical protein